MNRFVAALPEVTPRDRRTLLAGAGIVLTLLLAFRAAPAWLAWVRERRAAAAELAVRLAGARATIRRPLPAHGLPDTLVAAHRALQPAFLEGDTPAQGAAALASYLADQARSAGVQLSTVSPMVDSAAAYEPIYRARVHADMTGDVRGVLDLLHALEIGVAPLVAVRSLVITPADPAAPADRPEVLRVSLELEGVARRNPPTPRLQAVP